MNQLTTTNNFILDKTIMEQVLEVCGYKFTVVTPSPSALVFSGNKPEPHFIAQEVADSVGYARNDYLTKQFKPKGLPLFKLTYDNGLIELKEVLKKATDLKAFAFSKLKMTTHLILIPSSSLEEYLIIYARKPDAKELGKKLLDYFRQGYKVKPIIIKDDLDEALNEQLMKIFPTYSESIEVSKEITKWFESHIKVDPNYFAGDWYKNKKYGMIQPLYRTWTMAYHNGCHAFFINHKSEIMEIVKEQGFSSKVRQSLRVLITFIAPDVRGFMTIVDKEFIKLADLRIENFRSEGLPHVDAIKKTLKGQGTIKGLLNEIMNDRRISCYREMFYWMFHDGLLEEAYQNFLHDTRYVTEKDRALRSTLQIPNKLIPLNTRYTLEGKEEVKLIQTKQRKLKVS